MNKQNKKERKDKKKEKRERWNTIKTFLYLFIAPTSFILSFLAILKP
jgi:hypothetical protein